MFSILIVGTNTFKITRLSVGLRLNVLKATVHVGTDQNIETEIFPEYKYILNELLVKNIFFDTSNSLRDMTNERFYQK